MMESEIKSIDISKRYGEDNSTENIYYKLQSDINDLCGVMAEHSIFNTTPGYLQFALIKEENNDYYFFDVRKNSTELKKISSGKKFICPCCKEELFAKRGYINRYGTEVPSYLSHYNSDKECIFKTNSLSDKRKLFSKISESYIHYQTKIAFFKLANLGLLRFKVLDSYEIIRNDDNLTVTAIDKYKDVHIIKADMEKQALKKEGDVKGFRPDLTFYTTNNEKIYCEVTYTSGKTINVYYDSWNKSNTLTIEIVPQLDDNFNIRFLNENEIKELYNVTNLHIKVPDVVFKYLYSPVSINRERELHEIRKEQAILRASREKELIELERRRKIAKQIEAKRRLEIEEKKRIEQEKINKENERKRILAEKVRLENEKKLEEKRRAIAEKKRIALEKKIEEERKKSILKANSDLIDKFVLNYCTGKNMIYNSASNKWFYEDSNQPVICSWKIIELKGLKFKKCFPEIAWTALSRFKGHTIIDI